MTNKPLAALLFGCMITAQATSAQSLLPKPQSFNAGKGAFSTATTKVKLINEVGADAENIYCLLYTSPSPRDA